MSELLAHPYAPSLFSYMEMYIERKILPQINTMNAVYKMVKTVIRENVDADNNDANLKILQKAFVDEYEYLRFRITERFSALMKLLFGAHKKDTLPEEQAGNIRDGFQTYQENKNSEDAARAKMALLAKQLGLNVSKLMDEEFTVLMKTLKDSDLYKKVRRKK